MALSYEDFTATAGQQNFVFAIPYLAQNHISVLKNGTLTTAWTWLGSQTIRLDVGAALNDIIRVKRTTPNATAMVNFNNGSVLGEVDLDTSALQVLYISQEVLDDQSNNLKRDSQNRYDAGGFRIINLGTPIDSTDAVTKSFADAQVASAASSASAAASSSASSAASASAAASSATAANTAKVAAELAETNAELAETNAELAETNANTSKNAAATSASNAATSATNAATSANTAETHKNAAATSATNAATSATDAAASAAKLAGTSTTINNIGLGSKSFTTQAGKSFETGRWLLIVSDSSPSTKFMSGNVTGYAGTGLTLNVTKTGGTGSNSDWTIYMSGTVGQDGVDGAGSTVIIQDGGLQISNRPRINFIDGANATVTVVDNAVSDRADVTVAANTTAHEAAGDPHTVYQLESEKDVASGYAGLTAGSKIKADAVETASIAADAVTFAKLQNIATDRLIGRDTAATGDAEELTVGGGIEFTGTGIQSSAYTGDVTKAAGGTALTLPNDTVTFAKLQNIATDRLIGRDTAATGDAEELTVGGGIEFTGTGIQTSAHTGDVTKAAGGTATTIANDAVTYAKMQNVAAASKLLGRGSAGGAGDPEEITLGTNLSMSGTTLNATGGGGGGDSLIYEFW